jgi:hypothetical protein
LRSAKGLTFGRLVFANLAAQNLYLLGSTPPSEARMSMQSRLPDNPPDELPRELIDLARTIAALPPGYQTQLELSYIRVVDAVRRRRRILSLVQEALSQLRLDIKYLMFDLEMTRKERDELRERLGEF